MLLQHEPLQLLMAPSGVDKGQVPADQLIVVDGQGKVLRGKGKASAETALHLRIVEATQAGAVLHTHSCLLYTSPSPRDQRGSRMPSSA